MPRKTKMNSITSPELLAQVNPKNMELLQDFLDYLRSVQRSETSIAGYESDIKIAFVWCLQYNHNEFYVNWTKRQVVKFQNWLISENGNSPARVRRLKASLSSMSNYIESICEDEYPNYRNIIRKVENPINQPVREKTVFTDEQMDTLLAELTEKGEYEKACAVALALYSGRRKAEITRFRVDDFTDEHLVCGGSLYKTGKIKTKGRGTQGKQLECFCLAKQFRPYLDRWMQYRKENNIEGEWLFPSRTNPKEHRSIAVMNTWAASFSQMLNADFYWHALRHYFTTDLARSGLPDGVIQEIVGWESSDMVRLYKDLSTEEQLDQYFNEDGIKAVQPTKLSDL